MCAREGEKDREEEEGGRKRVREEVGRKKEKEEGKSHCVCEREYNSVYCELL